MKKKYIIINSQENSIKVPEISYYDMDLVTEKEFDRLYMTLCKDKNFQGFINNGMYGVKDNTKFVIYKNPNNIKRVCIVFIEKNEKYIICIDSNYEENDLKKFDVKKYIESCSYYSKTDNNKIKHIETKGLNELSKNDYKISWIQHNKKYEISLLRRENCYKYEIKLKQNSGNIAIVSLWDNYEDFDNENEPKKVMIKCDNGETIIGSYEYIGSLAPSYGLCLKYDSIREYLRTGEYIDPRLPKILYDFFELEKYIKNRNEIIQSKNNEVVPKVHYNADAIEEIKHLAKRYSICKKTYRP